MYIKIVRYLEDEKSEHYIFECWEASYKKVIVDNMSEFKDRMENIETARILTVLSSEHNKPFEFIQIKMAIRDGDDKHIDGTLIATDCTLYLMNSKGKTIDSMVCR